MLPDPGSNRVQEIHLAAALGFMPETRMKSLFNRLTMGWNLAALFLGFIACGHWAVAQHTAELFWFGSVTALALAVFGLFMHRPWGRWLAVLLLVGLLLMAVHEMTLYPVTPQRLVVVFLIVLVGIHLLVGPDQGWIDLLTHRPKKAAGPVTASKTKPMISLVHLRHRPRYLEARVLAEALTEAWGLRIVADDAAGSEAADVCGTVIGVNPLFMVVLNKPRFAVFMVHNHEGSYFDQAGQVAAGVPNLRFAEIIRMHRAWLAVDLLQVGLSKVAEDEAYRLIGKAISVLADDEVMAIVCPQHQSFNLWSPKLEAILWSESPLDALREEVQAPVYGVPEGNEIERAIQEARRRWPEFVRAFQNRSPQDDRFIVKAPFQGDDGRVEHLWLQVFALEPDYVHGHLMNEPIHQTRLRQGSQVEVAVALISDWICPDANDQPLGNFTHQAVTAAAKGG